MAFWKRGENARLAKEAGISPGNLSEILHRSRGVSSKRAWALEAASRRVRGADGGVPWSDWVNNEFTTHPAFYGSPIKED